MMKTTAGRVEKVLRRYALQVTRQDKKLSAAEVQTLTRLTTALTRLSPGKQVVPEETDEADLFEEGLDGFHESLEVE